MRVITLIFSFSLYLSPTLSDIVLAAQINFNKTQEGSNIKFHYQWLDHYQNTQTLDFQFSKEQVFDKYRNLTNYKPKRAQEFVNNSLRKHFRTQPISGVLVLFKQQGNIVTTQIKSQNKNKIREAEQEVNNLQQRYYREYLQKSYFQQFVTPDNIPAIKPDHRRIAQESVNDFKPLKPTIMAKSSIKNIRRVSNFVIGFIQSIPYATLESRITSSGAGFNPPLKLLWENQGDCDSKVTLAAAILRMLMPRINIILVFIDNHALIGIDDTPQSDDVTLTHEGVTYVLAEPTGPAMLTMGDIAPDSERAIFNGRYVVEPFLIEEDVEATEN
ncbi:hypothetical protein [Thalassotalea sediminis]|uniref:hypothetical protein n=1 Tax=Thalassotalea sediminis TaxID=1759089 RepID=UPI0025735E77|nr:hypothetical protein [Thalassotalea sediminis]